MFFEKSYKSAGKGVKLRTIIYGTDANAIAIANALLKENPGRFKIIGFIDQENKASKKRIYDIREIPENDLALAPRRNKTH